MKRPWIAALTTLMCLACEAGTVQDPGSPDFAVSDGAHMAGTGQVGNLCEAGQPCEGFYFLPPLVPTPDVTGTFNGYLRPSVVVTEFPYTPPLSSVQYGAINSNASCTPQGNAEIVSFSGNEVAVGDGAYSVGWQTGQGGYDLTAGKVYRICVFLDLGDEDIFLGFRDVQPDDSGADVPRNTEQLPIYQFKNGSNLPIKFWISTEGFCSGADCGAAVVGSGQTLDFASTSKDVALLVGGTGSNTLFVLEGSAAAATSCTMVNGRIRHVDADIPQFPGCYEITTVPANQKFNAIVGVCVNLAAVPDNLEPFLQLHHQRGSDGVVESLTNQEPPSSLDCTTLGSAEESTWLRTYAQRGLGLAGEALRAVVPWVSPRELVATHRGFGGGAITEGSPLVWGVPTQIEVNLATNGQTAAIGTPVTVEAIATTGSYVHDGVTYGPEYVPGALVTFTPIDGSTPTAMPVATNAGGRASAQWVIGQAGLNELEAWGKGLGLRFVDQGRAEDPDGNSLTSPVPGYPGPFTDHLGVYTTDGTADLGIGFLKFTAYGCPASPVVDGEIDPLWEDAPGTTFPANISGGTVQGEIKWYNDCNNLYILVTVEKTDPDKINTLRFDFDNTGDGTTADDDIWSFTVNPTDYSVTTVDGHLTQNCANKKQANCGAADPEGKNQLFARFGIHGKWVYEIKHPLNSADGYDFSLANDGGAIGAFLTLQIGNGAQGNTQYPGFRVYGLSIGTTLGGN